MARPSPKTAARTTAPQPEAQAPAPTGFPDELVMVPLKAITPSPLNPRKTFDEAKLQELAATVREVGVLQPVLLRPHPRRGAREAYELVDGERRFRASALAGKTVIPATVRPLSDRQVLEIAVVTVEQREDVPALEKAEAYQRLVELGDSAEDLAQKTGRSVSTIRNFLKLRNLPDLARAALEKGELAPSVAGLIARVPSAFYRERIAALIVHGCGWHDTQKFLDPAVDVAKQARLHGSQEPMSYREAKETIGRHCMVELKAAQFPRKSLELIPAAGSCDECPKRVGNLQKTEPDEYAGVRADICTDPECFRGKTVRWQTQVEHEAKQNGQKILSHKECQDVFSYGGNLKYGATYVDLSAPCHEDKGKKARTWETLLAGHVAPPDVVLGYDDDDRLHRLVPLDKARKIAKDQHGIGVSKAPAGNKADATWKAQAAKQRRDREIQAEADRRIMGRVAEAAEAIAEERMALSGSAVQLLRHLVREIVERTWEDHLRQIRVRRGLEKITDSHTTGNKAAVSALVERMEVAGLVGLLAEVAAATKVRSSYADDPEDEAFWSFFKIDEMKVEAEVRAEFEAKKPKGKNNRPLAEVFAGDGEDRDE